jgi:hypothetical protein
VIDRKTANYTNLRAIAAQGRQSLGANNVVRSAGCDGRFCRNQMRGARRRRTMRDAMRQGSNKSVCYEFRGDENVD